MSFDKQIGLLSEPTMFGNFEVLSEEEAADRGGAEHLALLFQRNIPEGHFRVLAQNGAGCIVALWRETLDTPWEEAPMAWLDTDGAPHATFAATLGDFLGLALYPEGEIYDAILAVESASDATRNELIARWATRTEEARASLRDEAEEMGEAEDHDAMIEKVRAAGASSVDNLFTTIEQGYRRHGALRPWADRFDPA